MKGTPLKKTIAALAIAGVAAFGLAGCSPSSSSSDAATSITLWASGDNSGKDNLAKFVKAYNKGHKDQVTLKETPFANYDSVLNQAFNAKSGPDVAFVNSVSAGTFASKGYLADITKVVSETGNLAPSNFYPGFLDSTKWKGKQIALPLDTGSRIVQYNKKLFDKAGVAPIGETITWDQLVSATQKVKALGGDYQGFCYAGGQNWLALYEDIGPLVHQAGGAFFNKDMTKSTIDSAAGIAAFDTYAKLAATGDQSNIVGQDTAKCAEALGAGTVGAQIAGFWNIPSEKQITGDFELGQALLKDKSVYSSTGGWTMAVPSYVNSSKYAAIKEFLTTMYKPTNIVQATGLMPATVNGRKAQTSLGASEYDLYWKILSENAGHPIPLNPQLSNQATIVMNALQSVAQGQDTKTVLAKAQSDLTATVGK
jgi:multiple sugar transport system substrate-binding protein